MIETEIKLRVASAEVAGLLLRDAGWAPGERHRERNSVYDTPDRRLLAEGKLLRVRAVAGRGELTVKLPVAAQGAHKVREEFNLPAESAADLERMVEGLGFAPAWRYEKYRTRYERPGADGVIELDETPAGVFLELEGPAAWIDREAAALGFSPADYLTATYRDVFLEWRRGRNPPPEHMLFDGDGD